MLASVQKLCLFGALLALVSLGCERVVAPAGLLEETAPTASLSSQKLRTLLIDYVPRFVGQVEQGADRMLAESSDPLIRHHALMWKAYAVPACFRAASRPDPLAAYLDVWILTKQMNALFEQPSGTPLFGPWQPGAVETSRRLEDPLRHIYATLGVELPIGEEFVTRFAATHPLENLYFDRTSIAVDNIQSIVVPKEDMMQVVGKLSEDLDELRRLSALYSEFVPKLARWQAELLMEGALARGPMAAALGDAALAARAADRLAYVAESVPVTVANERQALQSIVASERQQVLQEFDRMRLETLAAVRAERDVVLATFHQERIDTGEALLEASQTTIDSAEGLVERRTAQLVDGGHSLLERAFDRLVQLLVIAIVATVGILLFRRRKPRYPRITRSKRGLQRSDLRPVIEDDEQAPRAAA